MPTYSNALEFERPLVQLERQITELESHADKQGVDIAAELRNLRASHATMLKKIYANLTAWNTVKVARDRGVHPIDYIRAFVQDFVELHGDRLYGDDRAILTGFGRIGPKRDAIKCLIVASMKGKDYKESIACNYGCALPEGYRKALLKMKLAEKYGLPIVTLVDTPGAYPALGGEERGVARAIAVNLQEMSRLRVPIISVITGEGGSGGALGIAVADRVAMMQYAWYSVISPEGCAAILWKTTEPLADAFPLAAESLKVTAPDNLKLGTIDQIIAEPLGGAHRDPDTAADNLQRWIIQTLQELTRLKPESLVNKRFDRFRNMGKFAEA